MKTVFDNVDDLKNELERLKIVEDEIIFLKKQHLAYQLCDFMKNANLTETMIVRDVWEIHSQTLIAVFFDAKTKKENHYAGTLQQIEDGSYVELASYENRYRKNPEFKDLKGMRNMFENFFDSNEVLKNTVVESMKGRPFVAEISSILACVMSESEYREWAVMSERQSMDKVIEKSKAVNRISLEHSRKDKKI